MTTLRFLSSRDEAGNIRTFIFETGGKAWLPGQYQRYVMPSLEGDSKARKRFFTIASAPSENEIHISTRVSDSAFKQALNSLQPGDEIEAQGVEGDFTWKDSTSIVMVAGGIGVTPFRSMFVERDMQGQPINAHLLYFGRDENFAFKNEFALITRDHPELTIDYIIGQPVSAENILAFAPESVSQTVYLSGPEAMVDAVGEELTNRGVMIKQDWFPGYTEETY